MHFTQLNTSVELKLCQEAFQSVEDVHNLLTMTKEAPKPVMMANYYEKLTKTFLMSRNALYYGGVITQSYINIRGVSDKELGKLASQVLVSGSTVSVGQHVEGGKGKNA